MSEGHTPCPRKEILHIILQRFDLRLRLGLGLGRCYVVLDLAYVHTWIYCTGKRYFCALDDA
jgi:hypothetical protein